MLFRSLSLYLPMVLHIFTFFCFLFTPSPNCVPNPASLSSFSLFCSIYGCSCNHQHLPLFDIQLHCFLPPSPWIAHPIPLPWPAPPNSPFFFFFFFVILWTRSIQEHSLKFKGVASNPLVVPHIPFLQA